MATTDIDTISGTPETGAPSRRLDYYREVTERIREAEVDVVLNLTAGMGGDMIFGSPERPRRLWAISPVAIFIPFEIAEWAEAQ